MKKRSRLSTFTALASACLLQGFIHAEIAITQDDLLCFVNILQGTDSVYAFSRGNTLPLTGMPWGMLDWSMQNDAYPCFFSPNGKINGFRATHQPSPWEGDYGYISLMPQSGDLVSDPKKLFTKYNTNTAIIRPDYERVDLSNNPITVEFTGTERCGIFRISYHQGETGRLILNAFKDAEFKVEGRTIYLISHAQTGGAPENFTSYFVIQMDRDLSTNGIIPPPLPPTPQPPKLPALATATATPKPSKPKVDPKNITAFVEFKVSANDPVIVKVANSFISWDQAKQNLQNETAAGFDAVHQRAATIWNQNLGKIEVTGTEDQKKTFYSCFYRAQMFPHRLYELDATGKPIHYSPYDGKIHDGVLYGDSGVWDAFRTTFPLTTLIFPEQTGEILQGFVNATVEEGWAPPEWPHPGFLGKGGMIGQHCAAIFADAMVKGLKGFDAKTAYEYLKRCAFEVPKKGGDTRQGMGDYLKYGYVTPQGSRYCLSCTLDYAYDDWCVAQMAKALSDTKTENALTDRSKKYPILWDSTVGFMRAKDKDGKWIEPFDEFLWGGPYCESGAWQSSWFAPHDPAGLAALLGGREKFAAKMDQLFALPPTFHYGKGGYGGGIHEMNEMVPLRMGQCALGNQPSFHIPYLYAAVGQPWKTEYWTRFACANLFNSSNKGFCGDEDTGSMASWFVLSSIGLYPFCPGSPEYIVTSPVFQKVTIHLPDNKALLINAPSNSPENVYIQKRTFNGQEQNKVTMSHAEITGGGELFLEMGPKPKIKTLPDSALPYSVTTESSH